MFTFYILLMLQVCCAENFNIKTAAVGENVTLSCKREASRNTGFLYWIKLVPGTMPEILGKTFTFNNNLLDTTSRIATKQKPGSFVLLIEQTRLSDSAFYFCLKANQRNVFFLNSTFLRIKGPEPDVTAVIQDPLSDTVHEGDSVNLQCSVFSQSEKKTCPEENRVFWLRFPSVETRPDLIYAQKDGDSKCEDNSETQSGQSCVFNFIKDNISFSDTGMYYCAVAACGRVVFGNGTKLEFEDIRMFDSQRTNTLLLLGCVILGLMFIVTALVLCSIRRNTCKFCKGSESADKDASAVGGQQQSLQRKDDPLVYSTAAFTQRKAKSTGRKKARRMEDTVYSDVRAFDKD